MAKALSVLDRIKELDAEKEKLMSEAKAQALAAATAAIEELNALRQDSWTFDPTTGEYYVCA